MLQWHGQEDSAPDCDLVVSSLLCEVVRTHKKGLEVEERIPNFHIAN